MQNIASRNLVGLVQYWETHAWVAALEWVLRHYDYGKIRNELHRIRISQIKLPDSMGGRIDNFDAVYTKHRIRWWMDALSWTLTDDPIEEQEEYEKEKEKAQKKTKLLLRG